MADNLYAALQITAIGMSLVFAAILLLWGMMSALMRLTLEKEAPPETETALKEVEPPVMEPAPDAQRAIQQRAVAVAVAVALARVPSSPPPPAETHLPPTAIVSAWQAVTRARQLTQRGPRR